MTEPKARLIGILTERPEYREAYENSAEFRAVVQSIANLIPPVLAVAFETATRSREMRDAHTERLMGGQGAPFPPR